MAASPKTPEQMNINQVLNALPGNVLLVYTDGTVFSRKGRFLDLDGLAWPFLSLFSGTRNACRLYMESSLPESENVLKGPLELLLKDLILPPEQCWLRFMLTETFNKDLPRSDKQISRILPGRICAVKVALTSYDECLSAVHTLFPTMLFTPLPDSTIALALPEELQEATDQLEALMSLLSEDLLADPLIIAGVPLSAPDVLKAHTTVLTQLCSRLYQMGSRGILKQETLLFESLCLEESISSEHGLSKDLVHAADSVFADPELELTTRRFLENNLNINDTAQSLYIHRNTLVYRLTKIEKMCGLDLRVFRHAMAMAMIEVLKQNQHL